MTKELPIPSFFDKNNASNYNYNPNQLNLMQIAQEYKKQHNIKPAASQGQNIHLLLIDLQKDFCFPEGSLYVGGRSGKGAIEDNIKIAKFIYRNLGDIKNITKTMDTHFAYQIFFPSFWIDQDGNMLNPYIIITTDIIREGKVKPNPSMAHWLCNGNYSWLIQQCEYYCDELEKSGRYSLYLWPYHCMLGSDGHVLSGIIHEATLFHSFVRGVQNNIEIKGGHPLTENFSIYRPEVLTRFDGKPLAQINTNFYKTTIEADKVIIAGQAKSHCDAWTIKDLIDKIKIQDPTLLDKIYILEDCMSSVVIPGVVDFTDQTEKLFQEFADEGIHLVKSTDSIESW
jgi:nicotinamidase-related amidase